MDKLDLWERPTCLQTSSVAVLVNNKLFTRHELPLYHYIDLKYPMVYSGSDLKIDDVMSTYARFRDAIITVHAHAM